MQAHWKESQSHHTEVIHLLQQENEDLRSINKKDERKKVAEVENQFRAYQKETSEVINQLQRKLAQREQETKAMKKEGQLLELMGVERKESKAHSPLKKRLLKNMEGRKSVILSGLEFEQEENDNLSTKGKILKFQEGQNQK